MLVMDIFFLIYGKKRFDRLNLIFLSALVGWGMLTLYSSNYKIWKKNFPEFEVVLIIPMLYLKRMNLTAFLFID